MGAPFMLDGRVTFSTYVSDLDRAAEFYGGVLGLKQITIAHDYNWAEFESGVPGCTIGFGVDPEGEQHNNSAVAFWVKDVVAARAELEQRGVRFDPDYIEVPGEVKVALFADPDGNPLMLRQNLA